MLLKIIQGDEKLGQTKAKNQNVYFFHIKNSDKTDNVNEKSFLNLISSC